MTREDRFLTDFESQLATTSGWSALDLSIGDVPSCAFAPSDFPGFLLIPGQTRYTTFDGAGRPLTGVQDFTVRVYFSHAQLDLTTLRTLRSDNISFLEAFFSGGYTLPSVSPGDTASIDAVALTSVDPGTLNKLQTRSMIALHSNYSFTLL